MRKIPEWQYPLYKESDKAAYRILEKLGKSKKYPKLIGSGKEVNEFLKILIVSQKMKDYRRFRNILLNEFKKDKINISKVIDKSKSLEIPQGIDESWAVFTQDKRLCKLIDNLQDTNIQFIGTNNEIVEFMVRFLLSQLLQDWRGPLFAIILKCLQSRKNKISELNDLLKIWDYTDIF